MRVLFVMKSIGKNRIEHPFTGHEPACGISIGVAKKAVRDWMKRDHIQTWESTNGLIIRTLCQKNKESVEIKQIPIKLDSRTIYRTLSLKGHLFKLGLTDDPAREKTMNQPLTSYVIVRPRFRHLGQFLMELTTMTPP
jgi:hypothetical protein